MGTMMSDHQEEVVKDSTSDQSVEGEAQAEASHSEGPTTTDTTDRILIPVLYDGSNDIFYGPLLQSSLAVYQRQQQTEKFHLQDVATGVLHESINFTDGSSLIWPVEDGDFVAADAPELVTSTDDDSSTVTIDFDLVPQIEPDDDSVVANGKAANIEHTYYHKQSLESVQLSFQPEDSNFFGDDELAVIPAGTSEESMKEAQENNDISVVDVPKPASNSSFFGAISSTLTTMIELVAEPDFDQSMEEDEDESEGAQLSIQPESPDAAKSKQSFDLKRLNEQLRRRYRRPRLTSWAKGIIKKKKPANKKK